MNKDKILEILKRKNEYISGEEISNSLRITRQALWKHIQELRDEGFDIVAVPHLGYKILSSPDKLLPSEISHNLNTEFIGKKIYYFETVSSTMEVAMQKGLGSSPEGTLIVSEAQTKGKGRLGRSWESPKYKGIYLSLILKPKILPLQSPILTLLVSISVSEAIKEITDLEIKIKWPNDLMIHNRKVGGILIELSAETDQIHFIVIGLGLNVNNDKEFLVSGATSLREQKKETINRTILLQEILRKLEANYLRLEKEGSGFVIESWRNLNATLGKIVKVSFQKEHLEGEAVDIDTDGALLVRGSTGFIRRVYAGDVVHCR